MWKNHVASDLAIPLTGHSSRSRIRLVTAIASMVLVIALQSGCLFRKKKSAIPQHPPTPVRVALLPLTIPADDANLSWVSLAAPVIMAKQLEHAQDIEVVPLWEAFPVVLEGLGNSRTTTPEISAFVASRLNARWASHGEITPAKAGMALLIDFIPAKATLIPFRYEKQIQLDSLNANLREALEQFLRYLVARPLTAKERAGRSLEPDQLRELAAALDREYGWSASPQPGKADKEFERLARQDSRLARLLFNPATYPEKGVQPANSALQSATPRTSTPADAGVPVAPETVPASPPVVPAETPAVPETRPPAPAAATPPEQLSARAAPPSPSTAEPSLLPPTSPDRATPRTGPLDSAAVKPPATPTVEKPAAKDPSPGARTEPQKSATKPTSQSYRIQVHSSQSREDAESLAAKLTKAGFTPEVERVDLKDKGIWYRIRLQIQGTRKAVEEAAKKLQADGLIADYWIVP